MYLYVTLKSAKKLTAEEAFEGRVDVAYWRKAYFIHDWLVGNRQPDADDSEDYSEDECPVIKLKYYL
jgi:hypothetical protein